MLLRREWLTHNGMLPNKGVTVKMSVISRKEYLMTRHQRYLKARTQAAKTAVINEVVQVLGYHRKHAIRVLNGLLPGRKPPGKRHKPLKYLEALPAMQLVWEALDYPCAERLHPVLLETARRLAEHGELNLSPTISQQLAQISRPTLARRIAKWDCPKFRHRALHQRPPSALQTAVPVGRYDWDESRPGALEIDLVEHNGGSSQGHYAYTLNVVDAVSGYSRRRAVLGRGQAGIFRALTDILQQWPFRPWGLHADNGSEFLNNHLLGFTKKTGLEFHRSRPYKKNDNAHVEQKNRQLVREVVGYERFDTVAQVDWLNHVYTGLDSYANFFLPMRKVISKERHGARVCKRYDQARTPFQRLLDAGVIGPETQELLLNHIQTINPLALKRQLDYLLQQGPTALQDCPIPYQPCVIPVTFSFECATTSG